MKKDFFISYTKTDREWAEWIAWQLEEENYSVIIQAWDFRPGENFIIDMQKASEEAERTIAVLSPDYLQSLYTQPEWAAAFVEDPTGSQQKLVPVRVRKCDLKGMLANIVYIDLVGLSESGAKKTLLAGIKKERAKPEAAPGFPGKEVVRTVTEKPGFPDTPEVKVSISKLPTTGKDLFGREKELAMLDGAWKGEDGHTHVVCFVAWGGVGKTALVNEWLNRMEKEDHCGARRVYGWSFYSQGAAEGKQASADEFFQKTLEWFGDPEPEAGSAVDKARRLSDLIRAERTLLILDGMEPLQYPPGELHGFDGRLKDQGLKTLLKELAASQPGLCVVTTRETVADLADKVGRSVKEKKLEDLSEEAGVQLLKSLGVKGAQKEIAKAVEEYNGHALALTLLGNYLCTVFEGNIRQRDKIPKLTLDRKQGLHARKVMAAYERWLGESPELNILRIMGLFDRPVEKEAIDALRQEPIAGISDQLSDDDWPWALANLRSANLLAKEDKSKPGVLDCHPLIREHFGEKLQKENPAGWREAQTRLYHYFKELPEKEFPDTLEEMAPLFAAVAHGCAAGLHQEAEYDVFFKRIRRGNEGYTAHKLGAFGADLAAVSHFFETPWSKPAAGLKDNAKAAVLNWVGFGLRAVGRLIEAAQPMEAAVAMFKEQKDWKQSAINASNLSELLLCMGKVQEAVEYAQKAIKQIDRTEDKFRKMLYRTTLADALLQSGKIEEAEALFLEAEAMQKERQPKYHYLYSLRGFQFCDLLLAQGRYREVSERAKETIKIADRNNWLLDIALDQLSLGRAQLQHALAENTGDFAAAADYLNHALAGLREYGSHQHLPRGLFARAECFRRQKRFKEAWADLKEAQEIAELGGMKLYLADYHLEAGKLCAAEGRREEAIEHFGKAKEMMEEMGYGRKLGEVKKGIEALRH